MISAELKSRRMSLRWQSWVIPMAVGFVFSSTVVALAVPGPAHNLTWQGLVSRSAGMMLLAAASVLGMVWAVCRTFHQQLGVSTRALRAYAWSAAIWLPLLFVLWNEHAVWVIVAPVPIAAILTHFSRRQVLAANAAEDFDALDEDTPELLDYTSPGPKTGTILTLRFGEAAVVITKRASGRALFATAALPASRPVAGTAVLLALLLQAAVFTFAAGMPALAESLLIVLTAATMWFFTTTPPTVPGETTIIGSRTRRAAVAPCFLLTCLALTPLLQAGLNGGMFSNAVMAGAQVLTPPKIVPTLKHSYKGIVLLAPPLPKRDKIVPVSAGLHTGSGFRPVKPLVIPFDGAYHYFEMRPTTGYCRDCASATEVLTHRGDPLKANIHTADETPLTMEAHQRLGDRINAGCCRAIDLALTNADNRYGRMDVEMVLKDIRPNGTTVERSLGTVPIASSLPQKISLYRAPVNEVLHFPIRNDVASLHFNEITLRIKLSEHRNLAGAKVKVNNFKLLP